MDCKNIFACRGKFFYIPISRLNGGKIPSTKLCFNTSIALKLFSFGLIVTDVNHECGSSLTGMLGLLSHLTKENVARKKRIYGVIK